jgi:hypothetical protein
MAIGGKILAPGQGQDSSGDVALNITAQLDGNNPGPWLWAIHDVYGGAKFATVYRLTSNYETQDSSHATLGAADPVYMIGDNRGYSFVIAPFAGATNLVKVYYVTWHSAAGGWEAVVNGVNDDGIKASPYTMCSTVAQPGSQYPIEPSNRFQGAVWLRGELWVSRCAKDSENRDGIEVSQFRAVLKKNQTTQEVYDATTITQQKVLGVAGVNLILPTMTWNFDARVAVAFMLVNGSNPAYNPSTWYAGHDQSGWHFGNVWVGAPGNGPLQNHDSRDNARAGDYFGASPDPSNSNYVWMFGQSGSNVDHQVANGLLWLQRIEPSDYS